MSAIRASRIAPIVNGSGPEGPDPSGSSSPDELVAVDLDDAVERDRQLRERLALELPNTLAVETERLADRLERLALAVEAETKLQDPPLALRQPRQRLANGLSLERLRGFLRRILSGRIAEEVAELSVVGRADRLVQRRRRLRDGECLGHVAKLEPGRLPKLIRPREAPARRAQRLASAPSSAAVRAWYRPAGFMKSVSASVEPVSSGRTASTATDSSASGSTISTSRASSSARMPASSSSSRSCSSARASRSVASIVPRSSVSARNASIGPSNMMVLSS